MPELLSSKLPRQAIPLPSTLTVVIMAVVTIAALYFAREVLVPIALALLLSFVLSPAVRFLRSLYFPRLLAVIVVGILAFAAISALAAVIGSQVNQLAADLPSYQSTLREKIQNLRGASKGTGTLERASEVLQDLKKEIEPSKSGTATPPLTGRVSREADSCRGEAT
jgi:predicted PurR-regulated permease PerM